ncbi:hypothetical protein [Streptomyces hirsutus]|uniref:hypothetical protein n=1 Tax=Streptomyces hirsutus TaxID=35620 RepID=UPI0036D17C91
MVLDNPLRRHTITVIDRVLTGEDDRGHDVYEDREREVPDCNMQPVSSTEQNDGRTQVVTRWRLAGPPGMGLAPKDRVKWRGVTYEVEGDAGEHESFGGLLDHTEVFLKAVSG